MLCVAICAGSIATCGIILMEFYIIQLFTLYDSIVVLVIVLGIEIFAAKPMQD